MLGRPQGTHCKSGCGLTPWYLKHENYYYYYYYTNYTFVILIFWYAVSARTVTKKALIINTMLLWKV